MAAAFTNAPVTDTDSAPIHEDIRAPAHSQEATPAPAPTAAPDYLMEETIIVGVPGSDFIPYEYKTESAHPPATTTETIPEMDESPTDNDEQSSTPDETRVKKRPGFFKRLLTGIGSIFRRSGKS
jgi:hypothetical protein